jgi:hypothetical protein
MTDARYAGRLSRPDLELLSSVAGEAAPDRLRADEDRIEELLCSPMVFEALFTRGESDPLLMASPFLAFAVLVNRVATDLERAAFVEEWLGPARTVPLFDVASLREFLATPARRVFLAELLASYTRVASGVVWQRTSRGWRRRRYSELDPVRLASLLEVVPDTERAAVCRRLGDLALFLCGVFPEHAAAHPLQPRHVAQISRVLDATGLEAPASMPDELVRASSPQRGIWLLEWLGRRAYRLAIRAGSASPDELQDFVDQFVRARRVLNVLTRDHLYPSRERWFPQAQ